MWSWHFCIKFKLKFQQIKLLYLNSLSAWTGSKRRFRSSGYLYKMYGLMNSTAAANHSSFILPNASILQDLIILPVPMLEVHFFPSKPTLNLVSAMRGNYSLEFVIAYASGEKSLQERSQQMAFKKHFEP